MGLRLDGRRNRHRRKALRKLWEAGERGVAVVVAEEDLLDVAVLLRHNLAEQFTDPARAAMIADRYRLTTGGWQLCRQLFCPTGFYPTKEHRYEHRSRRKGVAASDR